MYTDADNVDNACAFHKGPPIFHDLKKGWSCCNKTALDWDAFELIAGCCTGKHSDAQEANQEESSQEAISHEEARQDEARQEEGGFQGKGRGQALAGAQRSRGPLSFAGAAPREREALAVGRMYRGCAAKARRALAPATDLAGLCPW